MFLHASEEPEDRLGGWQNVEGGWDGRAGVEVRDPKLGPRELPLSVSFFGNDLI